MITIFVGYDPREACVYHTFCQSVIEHASEPVQFIPLHSGLLNNFDGQQDGTNAFIYSRYLVPYLQDYQGFALFFDGDMHVNADVAELWKWRDENYAIQVVKHKYKTKHERKYIGTPLANDNLDYPRKNWSSVCIWNCGHDANKYLTLENVADAGPTILHRFKFLNDDLIGDIPIDWNWLEGEYPHNPSAKLVHHTLGSPGFKHYAGSPSSKDWNQYLLNTLHMEGERQGEIVRRAHWHHPARSVA
jgi:hypothetical protein